MVQTMRTKTSLLVLAITNLLIPVSMLIFATGFFPYKPFIPGRAIFDQITDANGTSPPFNKVIFMVIDALRRLVVFLTSVVALTAPSDFVYSNQSGFGFTQRQVMCI